MRGGGRKGEYRCQCRESTSGHTTCILPLYWHETLVWPILLNETHFKPNNTNSLSKSSPPVSKLYYTCRRMHDPRQYKEPTEIHRTQTHKQVATYANKYAHKFAVNLVFVFSASQLFSSRCPARLQVLALPATSAIESSSMHTYLRSTAGKQYTLRLM